MIKRTSLLLLALSGSAFAWVPKLDATSTKAVIDTAYNRRATPVKTLLTVDLGVKDGAFAAGPGAVTVFDGDDSCLSNWTQQPRAYEEFGSRPTSITITGQADELFLAAQQARDAFKNLTVEQALASLPKPNTETAPGSSPAAGNAAPSTPPSIITLPDGHVRVYVSMAGLESERLRDAYMVALRTPGGSIVQPYRRAFTNDWKQGAAPGTATEGSSAPTSANRWSGTMVYYFDAAKAGVKANDKVDVLIRTEADSNCAYAAPVDFATFY